MKMTVRGGSVPPQGKLQSGPDGTNTFVKTLRDWMQSQFCITSWFQCLTSSQSFSGAAAIWTLYKFILTEVTPKSWNQMSRMILVDQQMQRGRTCSTTTRLKSNHSQFIEWAINLTTSGQKSLLSIQTRKDTARSHVASSHVTNTWAFKLKHQTEGEKHEQQHFTDNILLSEPHKEWARGKTSPQEWR